MNKTIHKSNLISKTIIIYTNSLFKIRRRIIMNALLIFFALPLATIILSVVLQKLIKNPILVAAIFFAIYLVVAFALFDATFLIAVIIYTLLAYITALIVRTIGIIANNINNDEDSEEDEERSCCQSESEARSASSSCCRRFR
jgi:predicted membrane protein